MALVNAVTYVATVECTMGSTSAYSRGPAWETANVVLLKDLAVRTTALFGWEKYLSQQKGPPTLYCDSLLLLCSLCHQSILSTNQLCVEAVLSYARALFGGRRPLERSVL